MMTRKVLSGDCLPTRFPVLASVVAWLALDRFQYPVIATCIVCTFFAIFWFGSFLLICQEKRIDPWND